MQSKFLVFMLGIIIATSFCICFYEGKDLKSEYDQSMKIWEEHLVHKANAAKRSGEEVSANSQAAKNGGQETALSIEELSDYIWLHESTRGKNNFSKCEIVGKINGIGYSVWGDNYVCFDSHAEEMEYLKKWINNHIAQGMGKDEMLCHYSGNHYETCLTTQ
jgi:hypothetical protein